MIGSEESVVEDSYHVLNWLEERLYPRLENQPLGKWTKLGKIFLYYEVLRRRGSNFKYEGSLPLLWSIAKMFSHIWGSRSNVHSYMRKPIQCSAIYEEATPMYSHIWGSRFHVQSYMRSRSNVHSYSIWRSCSNVQSYMRKPLQCLVINEEATLMFSHIWGRRRFFIYNEFESKHLKPKGRNDIFVNFKRKFYVRKNIWSTNRKKDWVRKLPHFQNGR